jgi:phosphodiesterase/alkaline phosphatase D-like protein
VEYGLTTDLDSVVVDPEERQTHQVLLKDLIMDTTYYYRVSSVSRTFDSKATSAISDFHTGRLEINLVSGPAVIPNAPGVIQIQWETDIPATGRVDYGLTSALGLTMVEDSLTTEHQITLSGLQADTVYYYRVVSELPSYGVAVSSPVDSFRTVAVTMTITTGPDATVIDPQTVLVTWETDVPGNSIVEYGLTTDLGQTVTSDSITQFHSILLSGLSVNSTYYYRVTTVSTALGTSVTGDLMQFDTPAGTVSIVTGPDLQVLSSSEVLISWETDAPANSIVEYGTDTSLDSIVIDDEEVTFHSVVLTNLYSGTTYYYRVTSQSSVFNAEVTSNISTFTTLLDEFTATATGWQFFVQGELDSALYYFQLAIDLNPVYFEANVGLGWSYLRRDSLSKALEHFDLAVEGEPSLLDGRVGRVFTNVALEAWDQVIADAVILIEFEPDYAFAYDTTITITDVRLALAKGYYFGTQEYNLAQAQCDILLPDNGLDPANPDTWVVNGVTYSTYEAALLALLEYLETLV